MNVIRPNDNRVICEDCGAILGYNGQDLRQGACSYYIECPVCGKMHFVEMNEDTTKMYDQYRNTDND